MRRSSGNDPYFLSKSSNGFLKMSRQKRHATRKLRKTRNVARSIIPALEGVHQPHLYFMMMCQMSQFARLPKVDNPVKWTMEEGKPAAMLKMESQFNSSPCYGQDSIEEI